MSAFRRQTSRQLHEEHLHEIGLLDRLAGAAARLGGAPPAPDDALWGPLLREQGHGDLADLLLEEHQVIRQVARPLLDVVARARAGSPDQAGWKSLRLLILELVDRLGAHARMEEDALVPVVEEILDDNTDLEIWTAHMN
jgi:hypothetical protein